MRENVSYCAWAMCAVGLTGVLVAQVVIAQTDANLERVEMKSAQPAAIYYETMTKLAKQGVSVDD